MTSLCMQQRVLRRVCRVGCVGATLVAVLLAGAARVMAQTTSMVEPDRALLDRYCVTCHNERLRTADLLLDQLDLTQPGAHAEALEKSRAEAEEWSDASGGSAAS